MAVVARDTLLENLQRSGLLDEERLGQVPRQHVGLADEAAQRLGPAEPARTLGREAHAGRNLRVTQA